MRELRESGIPIFTKADEKREMDKWMRFLQDNLTEEQAEALPTEKALREKIEDLWELYKEKLSRGKPAKQPETEFKSRDENIHNSGLYLGIAALFYFPTSILFIFAAIKRAESKIEPMISIGSVDWSHKHWSALRGY